MHIYFCYRFPVILPISELWKIENFFVFIVDDIIRLQNYDKRNG